MSLLLLFHGTGPTPLAAANTPVTLEVDTTYLVRARVEATGTGGTSFRWSYDHEAAGWAPVTTTSTHLKAVAAASFADGDDVPQLLGTDVGYVVDNNAASEDGTITLPAALTGSVEFVLAFQVIGAAVADEDAIQLRLELGDGTDLDTYTQTPSITVEKVAAGEEKSGSDALAVAVADAGVVAAGLAAADGLALALVEAGTLAATAAAADTLRPATAEAGAVAATAASADAVAPALAESGSVAIVNAVSSSDALSVATSEAGAQSSAFSSSDGVAVVATEAGALAATAAGVDAIAPVVADSGALAATLAGADAARPRSRRGCGCCPIRGVD